MAVLTALALPVLVATAPTQGSTVFDVILAEPDQRTAEVSTSELKRILADRSAIVLDARPHLEYAISHIPDAVNIAPKPNVAPSMYISDVADVGRPVNGNKAALLVLCCNDPYCGKSKRRAEELLTAGFTNIPGIIVRRLAHIQISQAAARLADSARGSVT